MSGMATIDCHGDDDLFSLEDSYVSTAQSGEGAEGKDHLPGDQHPRRQCVGHGKEAAHEPSSPRHYVAAYCDDAGSLRHLLRAPKFRRIWRWNRS